MLPLSTLSRRALVAVAALASVAPEAEARKRRKPPLAFVGATVTDIGFTGQFPDFTWAVRPALFYPTADYRLTNNPQNVSVPANLPTDKVRAGIVEYLKNWAEQNLNNNGTPVPKDRIAVTLL